MTDQNYKLVPTSPSGQMIDAAWDAFVLGDPQAMPKALAAAIATAPDVQIKAKPLIWDMDHTNPDGGCSLDEGGMGLWLSFDPSEKVGHQYAAGWGELERDEFSTLEEAKKYCQDMADGLAHKWAILESATAAPEPGVSEALRSLEDWALKGNVLDSDDVPRFRALAARIAPEPVCRWRFFEGGIDWQISCIDPGSAQNPYRSLHPTDCFCPHCGRKVEVVGND